MHLKLTFLKSPSFLTIFFCAPRQDDEFPTVLVSLFFEQPTPFVEEFLERIANLKYPKSRIDLFVHNNVGGWQLLSH